MTDDLALHLDGLADEHPEAAADAARWLLDHPERSRPALIRLVRAGRDDPRTRGAVRVLAAFGDHRDVPLLADLLARRGAALVWEAGGALAAHASDEATGALVDAAERAEGEGVEAAASALGARGDQRARATLEALARHERESVRYRAVRSLGQLGPVGSEGVLQALADDPSMEVRALAAEVLRLRPR